MKILKNFISHFGVLILIVGILFFILLLYGCEDFSTNGTKIYVDTTERGETLDIIWSVKHNDSAMVFPILTYFRGNNILFAYDGNLHYLNKITGETVWKIKSGINPWADEFYPVGSNDIIYTSYKYIERRSLTNGNLIWRYQLPNNSDWSEQTNHTSNSENFLYQTTDINTEQILCISKETGNVIWSKNVFPQDGSIDYGGTWLGPPLYHDGRVYVGTREWPPSNGMTRNGAVYCLDALTGNLIWKCVMPLPDSSIQNYAKWSLLNDAEIRTILIPTKDGVIASAGFLLAKVDTSGKLIWRKVISINGGLNPYASVNPISNGNIMYNTNGGNGNPFFYAFNLSTESLLWIKLINPFNHPDGSGPFTPFLIDSTHLYKITDTDWLLGYNKFTGSLDWATNLSYVVPKGKNYEYCSTPVAIENGNTVYMFCQDHIVCARRRSK